MYLVEPHTFWARRVPNSQGVHESHYLFQELYEAISRKQRKVEKKVISKKALGGGAHETFSVQYTKKNKPCAIWIPVKF